MAASEQHEPTMEEILASIRKIISEDAAGKDAGAADTQADDLETPEPESSVEPAMPDEVSVTDAVPEPELSAESPADDLALEPIPDEAPDDVLDLTEIVPDAPGEAPADGEMAVPEEHGPEIGAEIGAETGFASVNEDPAPPAEELASDDAVSDLLADEMPQEEPAMDLTADAPVDDAVPLGGEETIDIPDLSMPEPDMAPEESLTEETLPEELAPEDMAVGEDTASYVEDTLPDSEMPMSDEPAETEMIPDALADESADEARSEDGLFSEESRKTLDDALAKLDAAVASEEAGARGAPRMSNGEQEIGAIILDAVRAKVDPAIKTWLVENRAALIEEVKPYIRAWLDENLPILLADAMRKEVARAVKSRGTKY